MIGNVEYQCSCVRYGPKDKLIVGLSVAAGFLILVSIIIIVHFIVVRCRQQGQLTVKEEVSKDKEKDYDGESVREDNIRTSKNFDNEEEHYSKRLPDDNKESLA